MAVGDGLGMIQAHYIYCALYFYYYYISSISDHETLDPGSWGPLEIGVEEQGIGNHSWLWKTLPRNDSFLTCSCFVDQSKLHGPTWDWQVTGNLPAGRQWYWWCSGLPYSLVFSRRWISEMSRSLQKTKKVVSSNEKQDKGQANMYKNCHDESWDYLSHLFPNREPEAQLVIPCFVFNLLAGRLHPD